MKTLIASAGVVSALAPVAQPAGAIIGGAAERRDAFDVIIEACAIDPRDGLSQLSLDIDAIGALASFAQRVSQSPSPRRERKVHLARRCPSAYARAMRFLVLGPLEVIDDGGAPMPIPGAKERTILADLISHAGQVVSVDALLDEVWGEDPPRTAEKTLGSYISRLRRALDPGGGSAKAKSDVIETRGGGYMLDVSDDEIDAIRFERLAEQGRRFLDAGRPGDAGAVLKEALGLWRGAAYQDHRYTVFGTSEGERLEELRRSALEDRVDTRLAAGEASKTIPDLEGMIRDEPLRERRWGQLMLALYRAGRQAESLEAFARARTILVDELGIEPGPDLQRMQAAILAQDPVLERGWPSALAEPMSSTDVCPYKGLARFETSDAAFYFGRERLIAEGVGRLASGRFLALVGASGSGKSSLMRAGLLHALEAGAVPGSEWWTVSLLRPGEHPLESLNAGLPLQRSPTRTVLAIDQFEEAFTACADDAERVAFFDAVTSAALVPDGTVTVVLAMRADFYGRCAEHRALASLLASSQILVGSLNEGELRRAIELPAEQAGLTVDHPLTEALVADAAGQPGGLPLLSTALLELWMHRRDRTLRLDDYVRTGGLEGAVARLAEDAFGRLDRDGQASARRILLRLAESDDGRDVVSRRAPLSEFDLDRNSDTSRALGALTDARLITVAEGTAEVAHEALLRDWPRLRAWLEEDAEGRRLHRHVTSSARAWEEGRRDPADLYRGARLAAAIDWADAHNPDLNAGEREFLASSRSVSEGEALRARRANRRLRGLLAGVGVLLVLSLVVGDLALGQRDDARAAADVADARQLVARSLADEDVISSMLLAREAVALDDSPQTRSALLAALQRVPSAIAVMHAYGSTPGDLTQWLQLSPDGHIIASGGARPTVNFFDAQTFKPLGEGVDVGAATTTGDFSADGGTLVVGTVDQRVVGIDVAAGTFRSVTSKRTIDAVLVDREGEHLFTAESNGGSGFLVSRDPVTLTPTGSAVRSETGPITAMAASTDGRRLVTTELPAPGGVRGHTVLWAAHDLHEVGDAFPIGGNDVALSPDGRTAAIAAAQNQSRDSVDDLEGRLILLDLRTGEQTRRNARANVVGGINGLTGLTFSPDGRSLISTGDDHRVLIWDLRSATIKQVFDDPAGLDVFAPLVSPDSTTLFTTDVDGNIVAWDLRGDRSIERPFMAGSGAVSKFGDWPYFALSPNGETLAIVQTTDQRPPLAWPSDVYQPRATIRLIDTTTLETVGVIPYDRDGPGYYLNLAFSPDSETLAVASQEGYLRLWNVDTAKPAGPPITDPATEGLWYWAAPAFSPDGSVLATSVNETGSKGGVFLWQVATGVLLDHVPERYPPSSLNFTPDGSLLIISTWDGGDSIEWSMQEHRVVRTIHVDDKGIYSADVSKSGTTLAISGESGREGLWSLPNGESLGPALAGPIGTVDLSPDGQTVVAAGALGSGEVMMWDAASASALGGSFPGPGSRDAVSAAFSADGRKVFVISATGDGWLWDVDPASWEARACQIAGRPLTEPEWQVNLPDRPYDPTCTA